MKTDNQNLPQSEDTQANVGTNEVATDKAAKRTIFKSSMIFVGAFVALLLAVMAFCYFGHRSAQSDINAVDAKSLAVLPGDSVAMAQVMDEYAALADGSYAANMRAKLITANYLYGNGDYQGAIDALDGFSSKSIIATVGVFCLTGDCYANLDKNDEAIEQFEEALAEAEGNSQLEPYVLNKLANLLHVKGDFAKEAEVRQQLLNKYPGYNSQSVMEAEYERAVAANK